MMKLNENKKKFNEHMVKNLPNVKYKIYPMLTFGIWEMRMKGRERQTQIIDIFLSFGVSAPTRVPFQFLSMTVP